MPERPLVPAPQVASAGNRKGLEALPPAPAAGVAASPERIKGLPAAPQVAAHNGQPVRLKP